VSGKSRLLSDLVRARALTVFTECTLTGGICLRRMGVCMQTHTCLCYLSWGFSDMFMGIRTVVLSLTDPSFIYLFFGVI
jgi:hypothetical protein